MSEEIDYNLIKTIAETPSLPQRQLAEQLGCSLGKINYCLKALIEKGLIKVENFCNSENKRGYAYKLTPAGIEEKAKLAVRFLRRKIQEYDRLKREIAELKKEVSVLEVKE